MNKGFTLIELLVVVLIIGILAAIALPQYTKAVERSRMSEAVQWLGDMATAQSIYYMQHGDFATNRTTQLNALGDVQIPAIGDAWTETAVGGTTTVTRAGGMFQNGTLSIQVDADGTLHKTCNSSAITGSNKAEFCTMAGTAGYSAS